jgi:cephalosporin-C deacetylase-like acetyl esterase
MPHHFRPLPSQLPFIVVAACAASVAISAGIEPRQSAPATPGATFQRWVDDQAQAAMAAGARRRAAVQSAEAVRQRAVETRDTILAAIGGLPDTKTPLHARVTNRLDRDGYRIEALVYESLPGVYVTASLYVPDGPGPFPALLGTAGHGGLSRAVPLYQHVWATLAKRGVVVLAYDPPGQGERLEYINPATGKSRYGIGTAEHNHTGQQMLLTGTSLVRYLAWDGIRALDYLLTRPEVDATRIGVAGNSGGGTQAAWLGVLEPRIGVIDSSCYITSWQAMWASPGPQDMEQIIPGMVAHGLDFADMIAAALPRPYLVSSAIRDFFPIAGARASVADAQRLYALAGASGHVEQFAFDDTHGWSQPRREAAYRWFGRWWQAPAISAPEEDVTIETLDTVRATTTGQVATSFPDARMTFDVNKDRALELARTRHAATTDAIRALLDVPRSTDATITGRQPAPAVNGLRAERLTIAPANGPGLPALLIHPKGTPTGTVVVTDGRKMTDGGQAGAATAAAWAARGYLALAVDVRGAGALAPTRAESGYTADYQLAADAWLLGTSVVAWQTQDLVAALAVLEHEQPSAGTRAIDATGLTVPAALFAAALHPVNEVRAADGIVSYLDLATTRDYKAPARIFVPGLLNVTDLPEAMTLAAPAVIHLASPVRADGTPIRDAAALREALGVAAPANVRLEANGGGMQ